VTIPIQYGDDTAGTAQEYEVELSPSDCGAIDMSVDSFGCTGCVLPYTATGSEITFTPSETLQNFFKMDIDSTLPQGIYEFRYRATSTFTSSLNTFKSDTKTG